MTTPTGPTWLVWVTRISLVLGVIALGVMIATVGVDTLLSHLARIGPWFGVLLAVEALQSTCDAGVVYTLTRGTNAPSFRKVCVAQFAGRAVSSVTPGGNLGEGLKISLLGGTPRIVAAVMFSSLGVFVAGLAIVALGSIATALLFTMPLAAEISLIVAGIVTAGIVVGTLVLVRRGMLASLARTARRLHVISRARYERWAHYLDDVDRRLRENKRRGTAMVLVVISQVLQRLVVWLTLLAAGYSLDAPQLVAVISAGVLLMWLSAIVPLGVGVSEGGHGALFALIGAPASLGIALAVARRVNQIVFAGVGFAVLALDRLSTHAELEPV